MASPLQIGSWQIGTIPEGWEILPGHGLRRAAPNVFPSTVVMVEEPLPEGLTLETYVANQVQVIRALLPHSNIKGPSPTALPQIESAQKLGVFYQSQDGRAVVQTQLYTASSGQVGVVTFTTLEDEFAQIGGAFQAIGSGLKFQKAPEPAPAGPR